MVICGDINLPKISWDSVDSASGANELPFIEALHDHFLTQINHAPTRGSNILDLVITSAPEHTKVTEVLSPDKAGVFTDHCVVLFNYNSLLMRPHTRANMSTTTQLAILKVCVKLCRQSICLLVGHNIIDDDGRCWKDLLLAAVKDFVSSKRLKGRNPVPWIDSNILNLITKKHSVRQKLKLHPNAGLKENP